MGLGVAVLEGRSTVEEFGDIESVMGSLWFQFRVKVARDARKWTRLCQS
jgi:hypothetical protein